ncbi:MAG: hypothetical protein ACTSUK_02755 [Promethearchaeota archaeon]
MFKKFQRIKNVFILKPQRLIKMIFPDLIAIAIHVDSRFERLLVNCPVCHDELLIIEFNENGIQDLDGNEVDPEFLTCNKCNIFILKKKGEKNKC